MPSIQGLKNKTSEPIEFGNIRVAPNSILLLTDNVLLAIRDAYGTLLRYAQNDVVGVNTLEEELVFPCREAMHDEIRSMISEIKIGEIDPPLYFERLVTSDTDLLP